MPIDDFDLAIAPLKDLGGLSGDPSNFRIDPGVSQVGAPGDSESIHTIIQTSREVWRLLAQRCGVTEIGSSQHLKEHGRIGHGAGHGARLGELIGGGAAIPTEPRHAALGGLMPKTPQKLAGIRMEPPPSLPLARVHRPEARADAAPPLDPPEVLSGFQGLRQGPSSADSDVPVMPNSGVFVLPRITAPAFRSFSTTVAVTLETLCSRILDPAVMGTPSISMRSLKATGMPWKGPR